MNGGQRSIFCAVMYRLVCLFFAFFGAMQIDFSLCLLRFFFFAPCGGCGRLREAVLEGWGCTDFKCCCMSLWPH